MFVVQLLANSAVTLCLEHTQQFHISHFTYHVKYYQLGIIWKLIIGEAVNKALTSYIRLCNFVILNSNEPIKVTHLQKLANQLVLNGAFW